MKWEHCPGRRNLPISIQPLLISHWFSFLKILPVTRKENFPFPKGKWSMKTYIDQLVGRNSRHTGAYTGRMRTHKPWSYGENSPVFKASCASNRRKAAQPRENKAGLRSACRAGSSIPIVGPHGQISNLTQMSHICNLGLAIPGTGTYILLFGWGGMEILRGSWSHQSLHASVN